ncbi:MAG TPA: TIM barrel protein [Candidatus Synoicihabitans sp.]|nr:TIM barrel protein [Candidatus Synoicihabitans sp.]
MRPLIALSTSWCSGRHKDGRAMLEEIAGLGFTHVELSHGIRISLVPGILRAVEDGVIKVSSTHNFCPLPTGVTQAAPNLFEPSRRNPDHQDQWLRNTRRSIDFSAQIGAGVLVMHLGSVRFFWGSPGDGLETYVKAHAGMNLQEDAKYQKKLTKALAAMRAKMEPFREQVRVNLDAIREHAAAKNVAIGCENRESFEELPMDDDFEELLKSLTEPHSCGYWHDTGHAELKQRLGVLNHRQQLERNADRLLGFHLHDVNAEGQDHDPIGGGNIDFQMVSEFWRPHHRLTLELSPRVPVERVLESKAAIEALVAQRFG